MKTLILVRHAKSSWKDSELDDFDRPLNKRGKRDAPFMGKLLSDKGIRPDLIVSSPANRAFATAQEFAKELNYPQNKILLEKIVYDSSCFAMMDLIKDFSDDFKTIILFGHNPCFTSLCNYLANENILNIPTCGIAVISFEIGEWRLVEPGIGKLVSFEYPKKYFN